RRDRDPRPPPRVRAARAGLGVAKAGVRERHAMRWMVSKGWHGWALLLALIVAFDVAAAVWGGESMTDAARRWFNHGIGRWFVLVGIVYLAIHLTVLPQRIDPLDRSY